MTVADLLQQSRDAHLVYRENLPRRVASGVSTIAVPGNVEQAGIALVAACRARAEAHVLDPTQADPAWSDEAASHDHHAILDFYVDQLTRESAPVQAAAPDTAIAIEEGKKAEAPAPVPVEVILPIKTSPPVGVLGK